MRRLFILTAAFFSVFFFSPDSYPSIEWPVAERYENLVERYSLYDTDRIFVDVALPENFLGDHPEGQYSGYISSRGEIRTILRALSDIGSSSNNPERYKPFGKWVFYSAGKEILSLGLSFHSSDPIFLHEKRAYLSYEVDPNCDVEFLNIILLHLPGEVGRDRLKRRLPSN
jgi:hypothetical protein